MPGILTIYNCGTNYDRTNSQELIASLALKTVGQEGQDWIINPGPGSSGLYYKSVRAQIAGAVIGAFGRQIVEGFGGATGSGRDVNIDSTLDLVRKLRPAQINMAGWSRGAITCIEIANAITEAPDLPAIPISLFLVDPVPGPHEANAWNWTSFSTRIPGAVTHCSAILQEGDERGWMMAPLVDPFRTQEERRRTYPMPGPHSASVEVQKPFEPVARAVMINILSTQPIGAAPPMMPLGPAISRPGSAPIVANPPLMKMTPLQSFLWSVFRP